MVTEGVMPRPLEPKQTLLGSPTNVSVFCGPFRQSRMRPMGRERLFWKAELMFALHRTPEVSSLLQSTLARGSELNGQPPCSHGYSFCTQVSSLGSIGRFALPHRLVVSLVVLWLGCAGIYQVASSIGVFAPAEAQAWTTPDLAKSCKVNLTICPEVSGMATYLSASNSKSTPWSGLEG
jgi:hypothetical protein